VRHETRWSTNASSNEDYVRNRERYKITFGVNTKAGNWYSDLAFAMGAEGRSDNATFGGASTTNQTVGVTGGNTPKEVLYVKRAMVGYKPTEWLALEAGRIANPLYTTEMVWDKDLTFDGATAKVNYKTGESNLFLTGAAWQYKGDSKIYTNGTTADAFTNEVVALQGGFETPLTPDLKAKAGVTYYKYGNVAGDYSPTGTTAPSTGNAIGTNNLEIWEVPAELSYKLSTSNTLRLYGDWAYNADAGKRADLAAARTTGATATALSDARGEDTAWLLGVGFASQADKKAQAGDYSARIWYQETGIYALDPNAVDSDFFDSKLNMKGTVLKGEYLATDNVFINMAYGHATRNNKTVVTAGVSGDTGFNLKDYDLLQLDLTYKF
jgi:hypothetical protein